MPRLETPRLNELRRLFHNTSHDLTFLNQLNDRLADPLTSDVYVRWEAVLRTLDEDNWEVLKGRIGRCTGLPDKKDRGWHQIYDLMNEARAFRYLQSVKCKDVCFIREGKMKTPDIEGKLGENFLLCEVKTINISDEEVTYRTGQPKARSLNALVSEDFTCKLQKTLVRALEQMYAYNSDPACLRFIYLHIRFDDFTGENKGDYFRQIDQMISQWKVLAVRLVLFNERTLFHEPLEMTYAEVDNSECT